MKRSRLPLTALDNAGEPPDEALVFEGVEAGSRATVAGGPGRVCLYEQSVGIAILEHFHEKLAILGSILAGKVDFSSEKSQTASLAKIWA